MTLETIALLSLHHEYEDNNNNLKDIFLPEGIGDKSCKVEKIEDESEKIDQITGGVELIRLVEIIVGTPSEIEDVKARPEENELWKQINEAEVSSLQSFSRRNSTKSLKHEFIEPAHIVNIVPEKEESDYENDTQFTHYPEPDIPKEDVELVTFHTEKENDVAVRTEFVLETIYEIPGAKVINNDNIQTESDDSDEECARVPIESRILGAELVEFKASKRGHIEHTDSTKDHVKHAPFDEHNLHVTGKGKLNFVIKKSKKVSRKCSLVDQFEYLESRRQPSIRKKKKRRSSKGHILIADEPLLQGNIGLFKNSELNCYMDLLKHKCKAEHGAFIDLDGKLLLQDWGMNLEDEAAASVVRAIDSFQNMNKTRVSLFKLNLGQRETTCFRHSDYSFVGRTENYFTYAHKCTDFVVLVLSDPASHGSCMFQVNKFVRHVNNNSK